MTAPQSKRKWYQISLLSLLVVMTLVAGISSVWAYRRERERQREAARLRVLEVVRAHDGYIEAACIFEFRKKRLESETLKTLLDDLASFEAPQVLDLGRSAVDNQNMKQLGKLQSLSWLKLNDTQITDDGLVELKGLTELEAINLENCAVTDVGLEHLSKLPKLKYLDVEGTEISPTGKKWIQEMLPSLKINPKYGNAASTDEP